MRCGGTSGARTGPSLVLSVRRPSSYWMITIAADLKGWFGSGVSSKRQGRQQCSDHAPVGRVADEPRLLDDLLGRVDVVPLERLELLGRVQPCHRPRPSISMGGRPDGVLEREMAPGAAGRCALQGRRADPGQDREPHVGHGRRTHRHHWRIFRRMILRRA